MNKRFLLNLCFILTFPFWVKAQNSPLSVGKWAKIGATKQGIYKLSGVQLRSLGFNLPVPTNQLQLFSFDVSNLNDQVPSNPPLGFVENALKVIDGGDGQINENDYILFYNQGPVIWKFDPVLNRKVHLNYTHTDTLFYFLTIGQNGKRIATNNLQVNGNFVKDLFSQHLLYEKDSVSLLNSGKKLFGPPMGQGIGKQPQLTCSFSTQGMNAQSELTAYMQVASTSYQVNGQFNFLLNDQYLHTTFLPPVSGMLFDDIASEKKDNFLLSNQSIWPNLSTLKIGYTSSNPSATGWIDFVEINIKRPIGFWQDSTLAFSIEDELSSGKIANCSIQNMDTTTLIWDVTNEQNPQEIKWTVDANGVGSFLQAMDTVATFFGVKQNAFELPFLLGPIANQNTLQYKNGVDYVIITAPSYLNAANRYQQFQVSKFGRKAIVVNVKELYNDFSGGQVSPIAIRNYLKYISNYAIQNKVSGPSYLLLLGIGNFNARSINPNNELPTYESENATSILTSFTSDDFFSILTDNDDINNYNAVKNLSLSVGRIPARSAKEADTLIQKLINYQNNNIGGLWENKITWVADDADYNLHLQDAESIIGNLQAKEAHWDHQKIYLDLFSAVSSPTGNTYPLAFNAIQQAIQEGSLLLNYTGHGNYLRLAEEAVISQAQFDLWNNASKLPLMVTASCNFAPFDQPNLSAIAWDALMKSSNGIIGLVAANRLVFAYSNKQMNDLFIQQLLVKNKMGKYNTIGEALQLAKQLNWTQGGDRLNDLKFNLMGDPAMLLNLPNMDLVIYSLNDKSYKRKDTLLSGNKYTIQGAVVKNGVVQAGYSGQLAIVIYDATKIKKTLANVPTSMSVPVTVQENVLFKGRASVTNGMFKIDFLLPLQMTTPTCPLKIVMATTDTNKVAVAILDSIYVKYSSNVHSNDTTGPSINAFLNEPLFKQGGWALPNSTLYMHLVDSSGIQTSGNALGQDLVVYIDQNPVPIVLNNYFIASVDSYTTGDVMYALPTLSEGLHKCVVKAWDLLGNSNSTSMTFEVPAAQPLRFKNPINYPNPFTNKSRFSFETNKLDNKETYSFEIIDLAGNILYQNNNPITIGNRVYFDWNAQTLSGLSIGHGTYWYRFIINSNNQTYSLTNNCIKL